MFSMSETQQQPKKGPITTSVESPESWQRVVKIEVARELFDKEYAQRLKKAAKSYQKPGFRKGHAPKAMVERELGDMLRMEATEELIKQAWMFGLLENKLNPITDPALENFKFEDEGPMTFDLMVEVRPEVKAENYEGIPVKQREIQVEDQDVEDVLKRLQESRATFDKVDRPAENDDQILMDLVPQVSDGEPDGTQRIDDQKLILGGEGNMEAFNEGLKGMSAGDEKDIVVPYPDDHPNENLKGQSITFQCIVKEVAVKVLPELNDELAAQVSDGKTLEELKEEVRTDLGKEGEKRIEQEMDQQILTSLVGRNSVDLPPSMITSYIDSGIEEMHRRNLQTGRPNTDEEDEQYREMGKPHAETALQGMLLLESVRSQEEIKVTDEDVDERIEQIAGENGFDVDRYREFVNSGEEKQRLEYDLQERRTYDFLLSRAEIEMVPADTDIFAEEEEK
jgi:trigger factor